MKKRLIIMALSIVLIMCIIPINGSEANATINPLTENDGPEVIRTSPSRAERYFDSARIRRRFSDPDEEGYYIEIVFRNTDGRVGLINALASSSGILVKVEGEDDGANLVDGNKNLRFTNTSNEFRVYVPLMDRPSDGQIYNVIIPEKSVVEYKGPGKQGKNKEYKFTFETNYFPKADRLYEGTIPEYYDYDYPIIISGSSFHRNTRVIFRSMEGRLYSSDGEVIRDKTLYVYLPKRSKLPVGQYDIIISNGYNYETEIKYGVLSVVEEGKHIPNEEYRVKYESSVGIVKEDIIVSKSILDLSYKNTNKTKLEIDLDELMGVDTWVRSIEHPTTWRDSLGNLILKSKWANGNITNLKLHKDAPENQIEFRVGRVEPAIADMIKKKIINNNIKSKFIEVSGANFDFDSMSIEIPYFESDGAGLKMLRYDETTRTIKQVDYTIDLINGRVVGTTNKPGIFVIVD
jgi:hypothetical protein